MYQRQKDVLTECPICQAPINQNLGWSERARTSCGSDTCRQKLSRQNKRKRRQEEEAATRARVGQYCSALPPEIGEAILRMMTRYGYKLAGEVIDLLDAVRCKHDKIQILVDNADAAKRRAEKAEEYNQQLKALYEYRIEELQAELHVYQLLENTIHGITTRQLTQQPEEG
jgi:hypothetical protein